MLKCTAGCELLPAAVLCDRRRIGVKTLAFDSVSFRVPAVPDHCHSLGPLLQEQSPHPGCPWFWGLRSLSVSVCLSVSGLVIRLHIQALFHFTSLWNNLDSGEGCLNFSSVYDSAWGLMAGSTLHSGFIPPTYKAPNTSVLLE